MAKRNTKQEEEIQNDEPTIAEFSEDVSESEAPEPLPDGEYNAEIKNAVFGMSSTGKRMATVTWFVPVEEYPADYPVELAPDGTSIRQPVMMEDTPQDRFRVRNFCEAIGAPMSKRIDVSEWIGSTARIATGHQDFEGVPRPTVKKVLPQ